MVSFQHMHCERISKFNECYDEATTVHGSIKTLISLNPIADELKVAIKRSKTFVINERGRRLCNMEGLKVCPNCHYWGNDWESECPYCGKPLVNKCDLCGALIMSPFWEKCTNCGEPLAKVQDRLWKAGLMKRDSEKFSNRFT